MDKKRLREIRERVDKAQKGPWKFSKEGRDHWGGDDVLCAWSLLNWDNEDWFEIDHTTENGDFVAASRTDVEDLLRYVYKLRSITNSLAAHVERKIPDALRLFENDAEEQAILKEILVAENEAYREFRKALLGEGDEASEPDQER